MRFKRVEVLALMAVGLAALAATPAAAFQPSGESSAFEIPLREAALLADPDGLPGARRAAEIMTARHGGSWRVALWNPASHSPHALVGSGVVLAGAPLVSDARAEEEAIRFVAANRDVLLARSEDLAVEQVVRGAGKVAVHFGQRYRGLPVWDAGVRTVFTESGRLFVLGSTFYGDIDVNPVPALSAAAAEGVARAGLPFNPATDAVLRPAELLVLPVPRPEGGADYHLVWRTVVGTAEPAGAWVTHVDAHDGRIVWRRNDVDYLYSGTAEGDVDQSGYCQGMQTSPFRNMTVTVSGIGSMATGPDGSFSFAGTGGNRTASCQFNGTEFNVNDVQFGDSNFSGSIQEDVPLTIHWSDATPSRRAERDAFYWANETHAYVKGIDPTWDLPIHTVNVNVNNTCNANYNSQTLTMNFFREGGGCANTAIIGDVVAHEYGHGVQYSLLGSQGGEGLGEGNADICGTLLVDDHVIGRGFTLNQCTAGIRDCVNTLRYPGDVVGQEIHNAGRVICGFNWDAWVLLEASLGQAAAKAYISELWHFARKVYRPMNQPDQVLAYFVMDDDDGNLMNGTPNYFELCTAAGNHGFSCPAGPVGVSFVHTPLTDTTDLGPFTISATVTAAGPYLLDPASPALHYSVNGGAYTSVPMANLGGSLYEAEIPAQAEGTAAAYYLTAELQNGVGGSAPPGAPEAYYLFGIGSFEVVLDDNVETDMGWTVTEPGLDGTWERADPNGTSFAGQFVNPENDHTPDPGVICWVTGNPPPGSFFTVEEVDGRTSIVSPILDMQGSTLARGTVWLWAFVGVAGQDYLDFSVSTDGGSSWTLLKHLSAGGLNQWIEYPFVLDPFDFTFTSQMRFRLTAEDVGSDTVLDCAMDDFQVRALGPGAAAVAGAASGRPVSYVLQPGHPNPFNPRTEIRFALPAGGPVTLTIFDVSGRELMTLVDAVLEAGEHSAFWDGTDGDGRPLASGVYFYRLAAGGFEDTRRVTLLK